MSKTSVRMTSETYMTLELPDIIVLLPDDQLMEVIPQGEPIREYQP